MTFRASTAPERGDHAPTPCGLWTIRSAVSRAIISSSLVDTTQMATRLVGADSSTLPRAIVEREMIVASAATPSGQKRMIRSPWAGVNSHSLPAEVRPDAVPDQAHSAGRSPWLLASEPPENAE